MTFAPASPNRGDHIWSHGRAQSALRAPITDVVMQPKVLPRRTNCLNSQEEQRNHLLMRRLGRAVVLAIEVCGVLATVLLLGGRNTGQSKVSTLIEQRNDITSAVVQGAGNSQTQVEMVNVNIHLDPVLILHIHHLSGQFLPTKKGQPPAFDDKLSYLVAVDSAEIGVTAASMSHAMNTYVFSAPDAPLKNLTLSIQGNQIKQTGTLNKGVGIPFEMTGTMSATAVDPGGRCAAPATRRVGQLRWRDFVVFCCRSGCPIRFHCGPPARSFT
jgi:hypothetical protein